MTARAITQVQLTVLRRYGRDYVGAGDERRKAEARIEYADNLRRAQRLLTHPERAAMDMIAGRGCTLAEVARQAGRKTADIEALLLAALDKLAPHYEAEIYR